MKCLLLVFLKIIFIRWKRNVWTHLLAWRMVMHICHFQASMFDSDSVELFWKHSNPMNNSDPFNHDGMLTPKGVSINSMHSCRLQRPMSIGKTAIGSRSQSRNNRWIVWLVRSADKYRSSKMISKHLHWVKNNRAKKYANPIFCLGHKIILEVLS